MTDNPLESLGRLLTSDEASKLAARYADGDTLSQALQGIPLSRRSQVRAALAAAGVLPETQLAAAAVLRAISGASVRPTSILPVWTLPGHLAGYGNLTTSVRDLVLSAHVSVTCSTYNLQRSSSLWQALREVTLRDSVETRIYLDTEAMTNPSPTTPGWEEITEQFAGAHIYRTRRLDGHSVRNHAKFVAVDHRELVVTSANFSYSAEQDNVELGLHIEDSALVETIERQLRDVESLLYEPV